MRSADVVESYRARDGAEITVQRTATGHYIADCNRCAMPGTGPSLPGATGDAEYHLDWHNGK